MFEPCDDAGFEFEATGKGHVVQKCRGQHFQRNSTIQPGIVGLVDGRHPSTAAHTDDLEWPHMRTWRECPPVSVGTLVIRVPDEPFLEQACRTQLPSRIEGESSAASRT